MVVLSRNKKNINTFWLKKNKKQILPGLWLCISISGDLYNPDYGPNPVCLKEVTRHTSPVFRRRNLQRAETSPLVERRHIPKQPRPLTSPVQITNPNTTNFDVDLDDNPTHKLLSKSASNFPCLDRPPLQRYNSVSPSLGRKKILDKLSPKSLRKSVMLRGSRKSEPVEGSLDRCSGCGFPIVDDRVSLTGKGGKRRLYHAECFKCSV